MTANSSIDPFDAAPLCFLVGPTAAGKSDLALEIARATGAEILSLDSMLVYRGLDVGTAKPDAAARAAVAHHLLDLVLPPETFTAQRYIAAARVALGDVRARGKPALFVGGTGLYLKLLIAGMFEGPQADRELRERWNARYDELGGAQLHAELAAIDPVSASRLHANDKKRIVRAFEVFEQTGRRLSDWQNEWNAPERARLRRIVGLDLPIGELDQQIEQRTRTMLERGWVEEARAIREGVGFGPTSSQALGYREVLAFADGQLTQEACVEQIARATRQFARRQRTWFRKFPETRWFASSRKNPAEMLDGVLCELGLERAQS